ncbi:SDR family oxidoreductase [Rhabdaerophilum sp. SD176]|uniref:SDR family oxidoreductase n=1 Tax=Rhabdaerophilum sp. SD176 TaxID=2983548 RepID=UPI0024E023DE|nr:SDR family oxidoreductase [Rhabdaerophilum sp. SD176]
MAGGTGLPVAVISGGSSGIGLEMARQLGREGWHLVLLARRQAMLDDAAASLASSGATLVETISVDVTDSAACASAIANITARHGRIDWLVTSAGVAEPGMFVDIPLDNHRFQMEANYFGTLNLIHPVVPVMRRQRSGRITLISSGAAFIGIAGYSAYAPSKFAIRGLAESLALELEGEGIVVSVAYPPDTDTPQYAHENLTKPEATREITAVGGLMSAGAVARVLIKDAKAGKLMLLPGLLIKLLAPLHSLYAPVFRWQQRRILRKYRNR